MKPELQIKALAELDGWSEITEGLTKGMWYKDGDIKGIFIETSKDGINELPSYLTSYDAIIPLIQKTILVDNSLCVIFIEQLNVIGEWSPCEQVNMARLFQFSPSQLCEVLLRATGKWKD